MDLLPNLEIAPPEGGIHSDEDLTEEAVEAVEDTNRPVSPFVKPPKNTEPAPEAAEEAEVIAEPTFSASRRKKVISEKQRAHLDRIRVLAHEKRRAKSAATKAEKEGEKLAKREALRVERLQRRREKYAAEKEAKEAAAAAAPAAAPAQAPAPAPEQQQQHAEAVLKARAEELKRGAEEHAARDFAKWSKHMDQHQSLLQKQRLHEAERKAQEAARTPVKLVDPAPFNAYDSWFG